MADISKFKRIHCLGIGGVGLSAVAEILQDNGHVVSGTDINRSDITDHLNRIGIKVFYEHKAENVDDVDAIVGLHVLPDEDSEEYGKVCFRSGPMTTSADLVQVTVTGLGGHSSQPHLLHDPVLAASQMIVLLQQIQARYTDANETAILPITYIRGDSAINVVPERVEFGGAARTYNNEVRKVIEDQVYKIGRGVAEVSGCTVDVNYVKGYAPVINDKELTALSRSATADVIGEDRVIDLERPMNFSEDFSAYSDVSGKPGTFMILKAGNAGHYAPLHNPASTLNEGTIPYGIAAMVATAIRYLNGDCSA